MEQKIKTEKQQALKYHAEPTSGKISILPTKPCTNAEELSLAYSPGVAEPCLEIKDKIEEVYKYTTKGNLIGVISNGTAVLGLGNIGAEAAKPVMEGKGVLFKRFANIDVFDIEVRETNPEKFVDIVSSLEPTFGGINLEDIKAPECFFIEEELKKKMSIPVFHDDQHGTAIIVAAALTNALEIAKKEISNIKIVFSGAGAAAIACAKLIVDMGAKKENIFMFDSKGLITEQRQEINKYKQEFAQNKEFANHTLIQCLTETDVFIGVSKGNLLTAEMLQSMSKQPIVFALANPTPEIAYDTAKQAVADVIMATGRSDYPNQVNNVLGFPFIFRGALDTRAKEINKEMKLAAVKALAELAHFPVTEEVSKAYGREFQFGNEYIIPKPFDSRVLYHVAPAVAQAAMESGVAGKKIEDIDQYVAKLKQMAEKLNQGKFD